MKKASKQTKKAVPVKTTKKTNIPALLTTVPATANDLKSALLVVSLIINLFILIGWLVLQVTTQFDSQVSSFLFTR
jgi:hypothetical protein